MSAAVNTVELEIEAEEIRQALAEKKTDPAKRLAEIEAQLDSHWNAEHERRVQAEADFQRVLAEYLPARDAANEATRAFVAKIERAADLRRQLDVARRKAGAHAPESISVRASRDRKLRDLRQDAKLAAGRNY
jgi:transketolase